jgi:hypothetical protein
MLVAWPATSAIGSEIDLELGTADDPAALEGDRRFRTELGLDNGISLIRDLAITTPRSITFGLPLRPDEEELLLVRAEIQSSLDAVKRYLGEHSTTSAGLWLSYPRGATLDQATTVNVAFTDDPEAHAEALAQLLPRGATLAVHKARYSERELDDLHSSIFESGAFFSALGTRLHATWTIVQTNSVEIVVSTLSPSVEAQILAHFPPGMATVQQGDAAVGDACSRTNCGPPWRGGLKIYRGANWCTAGYVSQKYAGVWFYQLWTAGHCGTGAWRMGSSSGPVIGSTSVNYFASDSVDVQGIGISSSAIDDDYLYGTASCSDCVQTDIASVEPLNGDIIGAMLRNNGAASGTQSGILAATNGSIDYMGEHLTNLRRATYPRKEGDSGAPVIRISNGQYGTYDVAAGSHTHFQTISTSVYAVYTHIGFFKLWTGYDVYTSGD